MATADWQARFAVHTDGHQAAIAVIAQAVNPCRAAAASQLGCRQAAGRPGWPGAARPGPGDCRQIWPAAGPWPGGSAAGSFRQRQHQAPGGVQHPDHHVPVSGPDPRQLGRRGDQAPPGAEPYPVAAAVRPDTAPAIAATGVDLLSLGWLTHSVTVLDIGLDYRG